MVKSLSEKETVGVVSIFGLTNFFYETQVFFSLIHSNLRIYC